MISAITPTITDMAQIKLDDPVLDSRHAFTRVFLAAEYWKRKYVSLKNLISTSDVQRDALDIENCVLG
jgi:hypothetical protein